MDQNRQKISWMSPQEPDKTLREFAKHGGFSSVRPISGVGSRGGGQRRESQSRFRLRSGIACASYHPYPSAACHRESAQHGCFSSVRPLSVVRDRGYGLHQEQKPSYRLRPGIACAPYHPYPSAACHREFAKRGDYFSVRPSPSCFCVVDNRDYDQHRDLRAH
jgi:hypothetical protein